MPLETTHRILFLATAMCLIGVTSASAQKRQKPPKDTPPYTLIDLQGLPGGPNGRIQSEAEAVSEPDGSGNLLIVGKSNDEDFHPVVWTVDSNNAFTITDLVTLGAPTGWYGSNINDAGVVVLSRGLYLLPGPNQIIQELSAPLGVHLNVSSINNFDVIAGSAVWILDANGAPSAPISLDGFYARDISDDAILVGDVLGEAVIVELVNGALEMTPLGVLPGHSFSSAYAISNDGNYVVGASYDSDGAEAFLWSAQTGMIGLGKLGGINSVAMDVNDAGQVVGYFETRSSPTAFVWENGHMHDLNAIVDVGRKQHLKSASGINDAGHIVGLIRIDVGRGDSEEHGFVLVPKPQQN